jgi:3-oxoacyl-[acyl-carrier protein] reductase
MTSEELRGKVALVTGASRGIGRSIAISLASAGVKVMATARDETLLQNLLNDIDTSEITIGYITGDLEEKEIPAQLVEKTVQRFGRLDILVNNAGFLLEKPVAETSSAEWDRVMAINARAPFLLCQAACPLMKQSGGGTVIQIVSVVGEKSYSGQGAYTASKHALMGFSKVLAQEVMQDNIRVHTILPGGVDTDMMGDLDTQLESADLMAPSDIAEIVMFLLSHRNNAVIDSIRLRRAVKEPWF